MSTPSPNPDERAGQEAAPGARSIEHQLQAVKQEIRFLHQDLQLKETYLIRLRIEKAAREKELQAHREALALLQRSPSWRITAPLRWLKRHLRSQR